MKQASNESMAGHESPPGDEVRTANWQRIAHSSSLRLSPRHGGISPLPLHAPLWFWLTENLAPDTYVTLGAQDSLSHLAVCQAVQHFGLPTRCHAVTGTSSALRPDVRDQHDRLYGAFSKLIPANWDEDGLQHFRCASIDWLQVDGEQELEQMRASWRSWRRRLSPRAILSIHGVKLVSATSTGSWISRLQNCHPWADFKHGEGLLLLGVGEQQAPQLQGLFEAWKSPAQRQWLQSHFAELGQTAAEATLPTDLLPA